MLVKLGTRVRVSHNNRALPHSVSTLTPLVEALQGPFASLFVLPGVLVSLLGLIPRVGIELPVALLVRAPLLAGTGTSLSSLPRSVSSRLNDDLGYLLDNHAEVLPLFRFPEAHVLFMVSRTMAGCSLDMTSSISCFPLSCTASSTPFFRRAWCTKKSRADPCGSLC
jgi:hypothetical protein